MSAWLYKDIRKWHNANNTLQTEQTEILLSLIERMGAVMKNMIDVTVYQPRRIEPTNSEVMAVVNETRAILKEIEE